jgi:DNA-directed RNA polymerase subunit H
MPAKTSKKKGANPKDALQGTDFVRHNMVPEHVLLTHEEGMKVMAQFATTPDRLPKITLYDPGLANDPTYRAAIAANENLVGRIVEIRRISPTAGRTIHYRIITEGRLD